MKRTSDTHKQFLDSPGDTRAAISGRRVKIGASPTQFIGVIAAAGFANTNMYLTPD